MTKYIYKSKKTGKIVELPTKSDNTDFVLVSVMKNGLLDPDKMITK